MAEIVGEGVSVEAGGAVALGVVGTVAEGAGVRVKVEGTKGVPGPGASEVEVGKMEMGVGSEGEAGAGSVHAARSSIDISNRVVRRMVVTSLRLTSAAPGVRRDQLYTFHRRPAKTTRTQPNEYALRKRSSA